MLFRKSFSFITVDWKSAVLKLVRLAIITEEKNWFLKPIHLILALRSSVSSFDSLRFSTDPPAYL